MLTGRLSVIRSCYAEMVLAAIQFVRTKVQTVAASWTSLGTTTTLNNGRATIGRLNTCPTHPAESVPARQQARGLRG